MMDIAQIELENLARDTATLLMKRIFYRFGALS